MTDIANRDSNRVTSLLARDYTNAASEVAVTADPATGRLLVQALAAETVPSTIYNGKKTVTTAGTRVALGAATSMRAITVKALSTNTGIIYVGNATVASTNGLELLPGDTVNFNVDDIAKIYIDSSVNGEGVTYFGVV